MKRTIPLLLLLLPFLFSCQKEPGIGGKAVIRGKVYEVRYNNNTGQPTGEEYYLPEARVYIIYGDHDYYDDDIRTGPDGGFEFSWLRKGEYTVYTYSECPTCDAGVEAISVRVKIDDKKEEVELPDLVVENW